MEKIKIKIKKLSKDAIIPSYAYKGDAGLDLFSCEDAIIFPGERKLISTGISAEIPEGYVGLVWDKSGIALKGIKTMAGVADSGYRGEYKILLLNVGKENYRIKKGDKIAQLLIQPVLTSEIQEVEELSKTERGEGGFGSTG